MSLSGGVQLFEHDIHTIDVAPQHAPGTLGLTVDGRAYRYSVAGGVDLSPGKIVVAPTIVANHENNTVAVAAAVGATSVTVTLGATATTLNYYADGYMVVNDVDGEGIAYKISGHPANAGSASLVVTLSESIRVALTTSSQVTLLSNPWKNVLISIADQADMCVGVPNVAITAAYGGWVQTKGVCSALADETLTIGQALTTGSSTVGAFELADLIGEPTYAIAIQAGVDTEYRAVYLMID